MLVPRLVLVAPPQQLLLEGLSSGLFAIESYVRRHVPGAEVVLVDASDANPSDLGARLQDAVGVSGPVVVGITTTTATYQAALEVARAAKRLNEASVVVFGGHHAPPQYQHVLRHRDVDAVIHGEGEAAMAALLRNGAQLDDSLPNISCWPRRSLAGPRGTGVEAPLLDSEELDRLDGVRRLAGGRTALGKFDRVTYVSARGCPLKCSFCSVADVAVRSKSIPRVVEELRTLVERDGYRRVAIEDNFFAQSAGRTVELCEALSRLQRYPATRFSWDCQTRVESLHAPAVVDAMAKGGCDEVYLGVESFNAEHLTFLGKTPRPAHYLSQVSDVVRRLVAAGISPNLNVQVGLPGEDEQHRQTTLQGLSDVARAASGAPGRAVTVYPMLYVVYPGTRHFVDAVANGSLRDDVFEHFTTWEQRNQPIRRWLGYHFAHGTGGVPVGILRADRLREGRFEVDPEKVMEVAAHLTELAQVPGVRVFSYGEHLVQPEVAA